MRKKIARRVEYWDSFARLIVEAVESRHARGISQVTLAQSMSTKQSVISRFENMGRLPSYDFIARLSIALGHSPGMTLYGEYMAVIPLAKQSLVKERATIEGLSTQKFVERIVDRATTVSEPQESNWQIYRTSATSTIWESPGAAQGAHPWAAMRAIEHATAAPQLGVMEETYGRATGR